MAKISVIIPVYNTSRYLPQCLDSVIRQDYENLEIILVNDSSTDNSLQICKDYASKDFRIKIIDRPINEGVELARYSGYKIASGEYITYIDSDDWLAHKKVISKMYDKAEETGADYVEINSKRVIDRFGWLQKRNKSNIQGLVSQPELFDKNFINFFGNPMISLYIWGKLYRKSFLDNLNIMPSGLTWGEDVIYNMKLFPHLNKIYVIDEVGYNYRVGGITSKYCPNLIRDSKKIYQIKEKFIRKYGLDNAKISLNREFKEMLKLDIQQRIRYHHEKEDILKFLRKELQEPFYKSVIDGFKTNGFMDSFIFAMKEKDVEKMYEISKKIENEYKWRRRLINLCFKILQ